MAYRFSLLRSAALLFASVALAACSTDELAPSARLDTSMSVGAIQPRSSVLTRDRQTPYPQHQVPLSSMATAEEVPPEGVNMDAMLGVAPAQPPAQNAVVGLAEEQNREIAEGNVGQPVVAGIGEDAVYQMQAPTPNPAEEARRASDVARQQEFLDVQQRAMLKRQQAQDETEVAMLPRADNPLSVPQSAPQESGRMPAAEIACRQRLTRMGVVFRDVPRISNGPSCGIDYPLKLSGLSGNIDVKPAATLNCQVTEAFALWVKNELAPSARYRYLSGIRTIQPMGGYSCRTMNSKRGNPMSEHAHGNAIDVGKFVLKSGKEIDVRKPGFFAFREKGLLKAVRADSCKYFNTVLGPGSDPNHKDHFHFDLRDRKSGYRHCG